MRVLITGAASPLGQAIAARLRTDYQVRLTDREEISTDLEFVRSDLGHDEATDALVQGVDAIVHLPMRRAQTTEKTIGSISIRADTTTHCQPHQKPACPLR